MVSFRELLSIFSEKFVSPYILIMKEGTRNNGGSAWEMGITRIRDSPIEARREKEHGGSGNASGFGALPDPFQHIWTR